MRPSDLLLPFTEFKALAPPASPEDREWLAAWELYDLSSGLTDDEKRRLIRYGHYLGWFHARKPKSGY